MTTVNTLSKAEYSRYRGVSKAAVTKALTTGRIRLEPDGRIDPTKADATWSERSLAKPITPPTRTKTPANAVPERVEVRQKAHTPEPTQYAEPESPPEYMVSRARREAAEAEAAELDLGIKKSELMEVAAVRTAWARILSSAQQALTQMAPRLAPVLAAESNPATIAELIDREVWAALNLIAEGAA